MAQPPAKKPTPRSKRGAPAAPKSKPRKSGAAAASRSGAAASSRVVAVTGARTFVGSRLLQELEREPTVGKIVVLDVAPPAQASAKVVHYHTDLTEPAVDGFIADVFTREQVSALVHTAFLSSPSHDTAFAHELENIGTMHLLNAAAAARVNKLVMASTTLCYGAHPSNPNYLSESAPLLHRDSASALRDKVEAEHLALRFAAEDRARVVTILRSAPVVGPTVQNFVTRYLSRRVALTLLGYDPLLQFLHEDDCIAAFKRALDKDVAGVFNLAGQGVVRLSSIQRASGATTLPLPYRTARSAMQLLWAAELVEAPASMLDYLRYLCVADTERSRTQLGFVPQYSSQDAVADFLTTLKLRRIRHPERELPVRDPAARDTVREKVRDIALADLAPPT